MSTGEHHDGEQYEIRVKGHLDARWAAWFDGLSITTENDGTTNIHGPVADQAALHGLLQKLRDVGLPLVSVTPADRPDEFPLDRPDKTPAEPRSSTTP